MHHRRVEGQVELGQDLKLVDFPCAGRHGCHLLHEGVGGFVEVGFWPRLVDELHSLCLRRFDDLAEQQQAHGLGLADELRQQIGDAGGGGAALVDAWIAEPGCLGSDADVAGASQVEGEAEGVALKHRDGRLHAGSQCLDGFLFEERARAVRALRAAVCQACGPIAHVLAGIALALGFDGERPNLRVVGGGTAPVDQAFEGGVVDGLAIEAETGNPGAARQFACLCHTLRPRPFLTLPRTEVYMFLPLLQRFVRKGTLAVVMPDGSRHEFGQGEPRAEWRLRDAGVLGAIARNPTMNLGETYIDERWDAGDGGLAGLLRVLRANLEQEVTASRLPRFLRLGGALLTSWNNVRASFANVSHHYDREEALFRSFLDDAMHYSCAYFAEPDMTLEQAQQAKAEHIRRKLCTEPGDRVLDIGCGWGSLGLYLAREGGVLVNGVTLSKEQLRVAQEEARRQGLDSRVQFLLEDYRDHRGSYDAVVSVGMLEHVGRRNLGRFFEVVREMLNDDGVALIHTIGSIEAPEPVNPWIRRHIFPGGYVPAASDLMHAVESSGLVLSDMEVWRRHYAATLREWNRRFQASREEHKRTLGERGCRVWEFYLTACETAFEVADLVVYQLQLAKRNDRVPLTRDYLYASPEPKSSMHVAAGGS